MLVKSNIYFHYKGSSTHWFSLYYDKEISEPYYKHFTCCKKPFIINFLQNLCNH
jgi:hypothetical protein